MNDSTRLSKRMTSRLEAAIAYALAAHTGQRDRQGAPYILHPLHLMAQMEGESTQIVAVLHDVIEDTEITLETLCTDLDLTDEEATAVDLLTHRPEDPYEAYVRRLSEHPLARQVKLADLSHNMDVRRLDSVTAKDAERLARYRRAWRTLTR